MKITQECMTLIRIAARVPALKDIMGITVAGAPGGQEKLGLVAMQRSWLVPHPVRGASETTFDADNFARLLVRVSEGERHCILWLLNVWNPTYAKSKGWRFDLFDAMGKLDPANVNGIYEWLNNPEWP